MGTTLSDMMLLEFPEAFESERLLIRAPMKGDGTAVSEAVAESVQELAPWMPWASPVQTQEEAEVSVRRSKLEFEARRDLRLMLLERKTGRFVGGSGLHRIDWNARKFEIGYWVRSSCAGQGYISEAVQAITEFAVRELAANRIEIRCDARNKRSAQVAQRTGFTLEGILRGEKRDTDGSLRDTMIFAKVRGAEF